VYDEISGCVLQFKANIPKKLSYHILFASQEECRDTYVRIDRARLQYQESRLALVEEYTNPAALQEQLVKAGLIKL
tara:strand:- start:309 stop:536 length:228 start_codon:yes stop_codon:yes gene_type:complete